MFKRRENLLLGSMAVILVLIVIGIIVSFFGQKNPPPTQPNPTPIIPSNSKPQPSLPPLYNSEKSQSLLEKLYNRKSLSSTDTVAKNKLLSFIPGGLRSGVIYQSPTVRIEYVSGPDVFQGEIMTENIQAAKAQAVSWLKSQGLSQDAICNYPVEFYLNYQVLTKLRSSGMQFNPLAEGC